MMQLACVQFIMEILGESVDCYLLGYGAVYSHLYLSMFRKNNPEDRGNKFIVGKRVQKYTAL